MRKPTSFLKNLYQFLWVNSKVLKDKKNLFYNFDKPLIHQRDISGAGATQRYLAREQGIKAAGALLSYSPRELLPVVEEKKEGARDE